jgi:carboxyl-terminal processing protease
MMSSLDQKSSYYTPEAFSKIEAQNTSSGVAGLGLEIAKSESGAVKITYVIEDGPADRAGIRPGDYLTRFDGQEVSGESLDQIVELLQGAPNSKVSITIRHADSTKAQVYSLVRQTLQPSKLAYAAKGDIGYIHIRSFTQDAGAQLRTAVTSLKKADPNIKGFILDLRDCPGGLLDTAIEIADDFLNSGTIASLHGRNTGDIQTYTARPGDIIGGAPLAVLINENSAAGSEIVAGALQDNHRATIVGQRSFGNGFIQTIIPLQNGTEGALRLTTSEWLLPSGRPIDGNGVQPDIQIPTSLSNTDIALKAALAKLNEK